MKRIFLVLASTLVATAQVGDAAEPAAATSATVSCEIDSTGECRLRWDLSTTSARTYWMEMMEPEDATWQRTGLVRPSGVTVSSVRGGCLYRIVACTDSGGGRPCKSSPVYWVPLQPKSTDAIPHSVDNRQGVPMLVSKGLSLRDQKQQYNLYLLVRLMNGTDMSAMPAMAKPGYDFESGKHVVATDDEVIQYLAYRTYEARRVSLSQTPAL